MLRQQASESWLGGFTIMSWAGSPSVKYQKAVIYLELFSIRSSTLL